MGLSTRITININNRQKNEVHYLNLIKERHSYTIRSLRVSKKIENRIENIKKELCYR